jgi:hypothetical protein
MRFEQGLASMHDSADLKGKSDEFTAAPDLFCTKPRFAASTGGLHLSPTFQLVQAQYRATVRRLVAAP